MFDDAKGFIFCHGLTIPEATDAVVLGDNMWIVDRRLHKFVNDEILQKEDGEWFFLDGHIFNKEEICQFTKVNTWNKAIIKLLKEEKTPDKLRGAFCGFFGGGGEKTFTIFVDQIGNCGLYYYCNNEILIFASKFYFIVELLKYNDIALTINRQAVGYMLEQGFMLDNTTFADEIHRVCPGEIIKIRNYRVINKKRYYLVDNTVPDYEMTEEDAIDKIDFYFRQAVKREFEKDREYGYEHLVDLSGGLDSRMVSWCAHQMGYTAQVNFTYCRENYLDYKIAQSIALKLKHTYIYMPLDDFQWYKDVEEILKMNNGAALYTGITGGNRFLKLINCKRFGIEHTGMVGDAILSTFYTDEKYNYSKPVGNENTYSQIVKYSVPQEVLENFANREQFSVYTRGLLGAQSSYFIRQNYLETSSAFLDVDFLNTVFTIPFKYRKKHYIYLKWIASRYPEAANFGWEKWFGIEPKLENLWLKHVMSIERKCIDILNKRIGRKKKNGMNPFDFWMDTDKDMQKWINDCFEGNKKYLEEISEIRDDVVKIYKQGNALEKSQAITVLVMIKNMSLKSE